MPLFFCLLIFWLPSAIFAVELDAYTATYHIEMNGIQAGELTQKFETVTDSVYRFHSVSQAKGVVALFKRDIVKETSLWTQAGQQIKPQQYVYQRSGGKKDKLLRMDFDWKTQTVHIDDNVHPWDLAIDHNTLEKHVYQVQLRMDLLAHPSKEVFHYPIADGGRIKQYQIKKLEQETIHTPLGTIHTVVLKRQRDRESDKDRDTTLWCAPELNYLPVKLEHIEKDGSKFIAILSHLDGLSKTAFEQNNLPPP